MRANAGRATEADLRKEIDRLRAEVAALRRSVVNHPAAEALRFIAPFVRDAVVAGVWKPGMGPDSVEHEVRASIAWLERMEVAA
jgi:hypothetical protein